MTKICVPCETLSTACVGCCAECVTSFTFSSNIADNTTYKTSRNLKTCGNFICKVAVQTLGLASFSACRSLRVRESPCVFFSRSVTRHWIDVTTTTTVVTDANQFGSCSSWFTLQVAPSLTNETSLFKLRKIYDGQSLQGKVWDRVEGKGPSMQHKMKLCVSVCVCACVCFLSFDQRGRAFVSF